MKRNPFDLRQKLLKLQPDEAYLVAQRYVQNKAQNSLYFLCKTLLGYKEVNRRTHGGIIQSLESIRPRKLIVCPRGAFKSSIGVVGYAIWRLLNDPNERILIDSELYQNSKNFLREIKAHLESEHMTQLFGRFKTESNWSEGSLTIAQRTKAFKESSITCSGIGAEKTGQHYSVVICDDLNSPKNSDTPEKREKVIDHYRYLQSILDPDGTLVLIGTRYSERDIYGYVIETELASRSEHTGTNPSVKKDVENLTG